MPAGRLFAFQLLQECRGAAIEGGGCNLTTSEGPPYDGKMFN